MDSHAAGTLPKIWQSTRFLGKDSELVPSSLTSILAGFGLVALAASCDLRDPTPTEHPYPEIADELIQKWPDPDEQGIVALEDRAYVRVRQGETTRDVAKRVGVDPEDLAKLNSIRIESQLETGRFLTLPAEFSRSGEGSKAGLESRSGDLNISRIASKAIDSAEVTSPEITPGEIPPAGNQIVHMVQPGETAYTIARLYGVSVRTLANWNALGPDFAVRVNQTLIISVSPDAVGRNAANRESSRDQSQPNPAVPPPVEPTSAQTTPAPTTEVASPRRAEAKLPEMPDAPEQEIAPSARSTGFVRPLDGEIVRGYSGEPGGSEGIDIAAPEGSVVVAAADGIVALVSRATDQTVILLLRHPGNIYTVYSNIKDVPLEKGQEVSQGQLIGRVAGGSTEFLHFEIREGTKSTDPKKYFAN